MFRRCLALARQKWKDDAAALKKNKTDSFFKRVFPRFWLESAVVICVLSLIGVAGGVSFTATLGQELDLMYSENSSIINAQPDEWNHQEIKFEISGNSSNTTIKTIEYDPSQICVIGDGRTVGMSKVITDAHFIAEESTDLWWFDNTAMIEFEEVRDDVEIIVIALGIDHLDRADDYIARLNTLAEQYLDKIFVYVNVGPVVDSVSDGISNENVESFNDKMANGLSDNWIILDQYQYLKSNGFDSTNGIHYSTSDYAKILAWIINSVKTQTITISN